MTAALRLLVVTASMGGGHVAVAAELARRVEAGGGSVETVDLLAAGGELRGRALRGFYHRMVDDAPLLYDAAMSGWARWPRAFETITATGSGPFRRGLLAAVERVRPQLVVSTYNLASHLLGDLRLAGAVRVPVVTYVTDPGPHPYWVADGVDAHLAILDETAAGLRGHGARGVRTVAPLVRPEFAAPPPAEQARPVFGLPPDVRVAVVSAGSWGVGRVDQTVAALGRAAVVPVTLCAGEERLRSRIARRRLGRALGWTDRVPDLFAAADVLVDNAGGLTCWEALVTGLPVVVNRPIAGHGRDNAVVLERAGLACWARDDDALRAAVGAARRSPPGRLLDAEPVESALAALVA